jgi:hypothetical protein
MLVRSIVRPAWATPPDQKPLIRGLAARLTTGRRPVTNLLRTVRSQVQGQVSSAHRGGAPRRCATWARARALSTSLLDHVVPAGLGRWWPNRHVSFGGARGDGPSETARCCHQRRRHLTVGSMWYGDAALYAPPPRLRAWCTRSHAPGSRWRGLEAPPALLSASRARAPGTAGGGPGCRPGGALRP